jgi:hypothetical protein
MYTIAATDNTHRDDSMEWAALRDRPKPVFTRVRPTHAIGTMNTRRVHSNAEASDKEVIG